MTTPILIAGLDIETTGLNQADGHRIIEIALSIYKLETGEKVGNFVTRVNPERSIDPDAQAVHGIGLDDLLYAPKWEEVAPKVQRVLSACQYAVAHNGEWFDMPFVFGELMRAGQSLPTVGLIDTMLQARWATPDGSSPSLKALCFACGVDYDTSKAHAALYDVDVMMECFFSQFHKGKGFFTLPTSQYVFTPMKSAESKK